MTFLVANPLPRLVSEVTQNSPGEPAQTPVAAVAVVCRTVALRADGERLQAELERELRALLGLGNQLGR